MQGVQSNLSLMISNSFSKQWSQHFKLQRLKKIFYFRSACEASIAMTYQLNHRNVTQSYNLYVLRTAICKLHSQKSDLKKSQRFQLEIQLLYLYCHAIAICKWLMTRIHSKGVSKDYHFHIHSCESKEWKNLQSAWLFMYNLFNAFSST